VVSFDYVIAGAGELGGMSYTIIQYDAASRRTNHRTTLVGEEPVVVA
jgi:hypothetical protein